jgi:HAD superfamily hydrolase (TIGR01509 family)
MPISTIIFDMDGVLVDSEGTHFLAYSKTLAQYGIKYPREEFRKVMGRSNKDISKMFCKQYRLRVDPDMLRKQKERLVEGLLGKTRLFPGVKATLRLLKKKGYKLGLATSSIRKVTSKMRKIHGFDSYFRAYASADDVKRAKPAPDLFLACSRKLRSEPSECVVIEDSRYGLLAARKAGMRCIGITNTLPARQLRIADKTISKISQIDERLLSRLGR